MKKSVLCIALCLITMMSYAQTNEEDKETVYIDYFTCASSIDPASTEILRNNAIAGIQSMNRVILRDVATEGALKEEAERRKAASAMGNATARTEEMSTLAANYLVQGHLESIAKSEGKDDKGKIYHKCQISFTIKVINPRNGTLRTTKTYTPEAREETPEKALQSVLGSSYSPMRDIIEEYFKIEGAILQIEEFSKKKDKAKAVIINLGSKKGITKYQKFIVYVEENMAGEIGRKEIGRISAKEVRGENRTICSVNTGGEEILKAIKDCMNDDKKKVIVVSREQTMFGGTSLKDMFSL